MNASTVWKKLLWWAVGSLGVFGMGLVAFVLLLSMVLLGILVSSSDSSLDGIPVPKQRTFDIPMPLIPIYLRAENERVSWARLAAIQKVSANFGEEKAKRSDTIGSLGFPLFVWNSYQVDGDEDGEMDPEDPYDAIFSLANYFERSVHNTDTTNDEEQALNALFLNPEEVRLVHTKESEYATMLIVHRNWVWPVIGYKAISSAYGVRVDPITGEPGVFHDGIDIPAPRGTPVVAIQDGTVIEISNSSSGYGNLVRLQHGEGIQSFYGHLSSIGVKNGQKVFRGEVIGSVGSSGRSTGSHFHLGMAQNGQSVNPQTYWPDQIRGGGSE